MMDEKSTRALNLNDLKKVDGGMGEKKSGKTWRCACGHTNPEKAAKCEECGEPKPNGADRYGR